MRFDPQPEKKDREAYIKQRTDKITKYVALIFVFASTFAFFFKLLFF